MATALRFLAQFFRWRVWALALLLCASACRTTASPAPDGPVIRELKLNGVKQVSERDLRSRILTAKTSWLPFSKKHRFDPHIWQTDLERIERFYKGKGFFQAKVTEQKVNELSNGVALEVTVHEGQPTKIKAIDVTGIDELPAEVALAAHSLPAWCSKKNRGSVFLTESPRNFASEAMQRRASLRTRRSMSRRSKRQHQSASMPARPIGSETFG
jgi:hypothetical protein